MGKLPVGLFNIFDMVFFRGMMHVSILCIKNGEKLWTVISTIIQASYPILFILTDKK
jgi:hypothetical protein